MALQVELVTLLITGDGAHLAEFSAVTQDPVTGFVPFVFRKNKGSQSFDEQRS